MYYWWDYKWNVSTLSRNIKKEIMALAALNEITEHFDEFIEYTIPGLTTWTYELDIGRDDWRVAIVTLWLKEAAPVTEYMRRKSASFIITQNEDDAYSQAIKQIITDVPSAYDTYTVTNWLYAGYSYAVGARLSDYEFDRTGGIIRIEAARIDGSTLEIDFKNYSLPSADKYLKARISVRITRTLK